ncbi:sphingolipid delta(4)-desaturase DES1-like [Dendronephthya gigantea]|uniref:sphingolipid delta(4)-desaturase DES1-like n=1 Tax=Dendronephthya gigantea TaxID=151771 RepID=UPI00106D55C6|nr:sphingolipid delta(4)-desaturase DES1-like [Dendronephthya gigantea]
MGARVSRSDFEWSYTDEPHATRRKQILKAHPEVKKLMVVDHRFKYHVILLVILQLLVIPLIPHLSWTSFFLLTYFYGAVINHAILDAIHEISHNMAYGNSKPLYNRLFGMFANLPTAVPVSVTFKRYHQDHHRFQGDEDLDPDLPTEWEGRFFANSFTKAIYVGLIPFFYSLRPLFVNPKSPTILEFLNYVTQLSFDAIVYYFFGIRPLVYMLLSALIGTGWHPLGAQFIAEHYMFRKGQETFSYYGPFNYITFNVGYHNEHHDFPNIPGSLLPKVREIAPEFYNNMPHHSSWLKVIYDFVFDPEINPYARVKRSVKQRANNNACADKTHED